MDAQKERPERKAERDERVRERKGGRREGGGREGESVRARERAR
jgi:hypothetical protein